MNFFLLSLSSTEILCMIYEVTTNHMPMPSINEGEQKNWNKTKEIETICFKINTQKMFRLNFFQSFKLQIIAMISRISWILYRFCVCHFHKSYFYIINVLAMHFCWMLWYNAIWMLSHCQEFLFLFDEINFFHMSSVNTSFNIELLNEWYDFLVRLQ